MHECFSVGFRLRVSASSDTLQFRPMQAATSSSRSNRGDGWPCASAQVIRGPASVGVRRVVRACGPVVTRLVTHWPGSPHHAGSCVASPRPGNRDLPARRGRALPKGYHAAPRVQPSTLPPAGLVRRGAHISATSSKPPTPLPIRPEASGSAWPSPRAALVESPRKTALLRTGSADAPNARRRWRRMTLWPGWRAIVLSIFALAEFGYLDRSRDIVATTVKEAPDPAYVLHRSLRVRCSTTNNR